MAGIAVVGSSVKSFGLSHLNDVTVFQLTVKEPGFYVVFARAVIGNDDGDPQAATVQVSESGGGIVDQADIRIGGNTSLTASLQGTLRVDPGTPKVMNLHCRTFRGSATQFSLFAVHVDALSFD